jgi:hypothetical protein
MLSELPTDFETNPLLPGRTRALLEAVEIALSAQSHFKINSSVCEQVLNPILLRLTWVLMHSKISDSDLLRCQVIQEHLRKLSSPQLRAGHAVQ